MYYRLYTHTYAGNVVGENHSKTPKLILEDNKEKLNWSHTLGQK